MSTVTQEDPTLPEDHSLTPSGNLARRLIVNRIFESAAGFAAFIAVAVLITVVLVIMFHGIKSLNWHFLTAALPPATGGVGGIGPAILGTLEIVALTMVLALPLGIFVAIFVTQFATPRIGNGVRMIIDVMNGLPTIVVGVFIFAVLVAGTGSGFAAWKGVVALTIVILPLVTRATIEAINRVPSSLTEASDALGIARWRAVFGVILPTAAPGILTAAILAAARAAGETAPLLFTATGFLTTVEVNPLHSIPNLPVEIYLLIQTDNPVDIQEAWGAAFVLLMMILIANVGARQFLRRAQKKRGL